MHLKKLHLENWCQHESLEVLLEAGVNGIVGPNGNGKSNFLDAARFLWTGESVNSGNKEDNLRWGAKSGKVTGVATIGDTDYVISRNIHNAGCRMTWTDATTGVAMDIRKSGEMQAEINRLLATNSAVLLDAVFVPQGKIDGILFQKNTERLKEFQQAFGLAAAADAFRILGEEAEAFKLTPGLTEALNDASTRFRSSVADVARIAEELVVIQAKAAALAPLEAVLQADEAAQKHSLALRNADTVHREAADVGRRLIDSRDQLRLQLAAATRELGGQDVGLPGLRQKHAELTHLKANFDRYAVAAGNRSRLQLALSLLDVITDEEVAARVSQETEANNLVQRILGMLNGSVVRPQVPAEIEINQQFQAISLEIQIRQGKGIQWSPELVALRDKARELRQHIDHFATGKCPTCGQDVAGGPAEAARRQAEYAAISAKGLAMEAAEQAAEAAAVAVMLQTKAALNEQLATFKAGCTTFLNQQLIGAQTALDAARAHAKAGRDLLQHRKQITGQLAAFEMSMGPEVQEPSAAELGQLGATIAGIEHAVGAIEAIRRQSTDADSRAEMQVQAVEAALKAKDALGFALAAPTAAEVAHARTSVTDLILCREAVAKLQADAAMAAVMRDTRDAEWNRLRAQVATEAKHSEWIKLVRDSRDVLHVGQLPKLIMQEYGKILNGQLAFYLEQFQSPLRVWLDEDLQFRASKNGEPEMDAQRLSGGEKIVASVSFRLAMSDTFARQVGLLVLDEPSNNLDEANIQHLQHVLLELKRMSAHTGRQVLVVTHEVKLMGFMDHCVTVGDVAKEE